MGKHAIAADENVHRPFRQVFADETARLADATVYATADLYKKAWQVDTAEEYVLTAITPVWSPISSSDNFPVAARIVKAITAIAAGGDLELDTGYVLPATANSLIPIDVQVMAAQDDGVLYYTRTLVIVGVDSGGDVGGDDGEFLTNAALVAPSSPAGLAVATVQVTGGAGGALLVAWGTLFIASTQIGGTMAVTVGKNQPSGVTIPGV